MNTIVAPTISVGIIAFGVRIVAGTIAGGAYRVFLHDLHFRSAKQIAEAGTVSSERLRHFLTRQNNMAGTQARGKTLDGVWNCLHRLSPQSRLWGGQGHSRKSRAQFSMPRPKY
jgi:hypothetical protein